MRKLSEISVIVQGPIDRALTPRCLESVRRFLPGAEVILSTWQGSDLTGLSFDRVLESVDPGGSSSSLDRKLAFNVNRQIVSTVNGLKAASADYAIKVRTDMEFTGAGFLELAERYPKRCDKWRVFDERIVICAVPTMSPRRRGLCLSPSDWFDYGRRTDLLKLWDVPLDVNHEVARWFEARPRPKPDRQPQFLWRFIPEQFVFVQCLRKHAPVEMDHLGDNRRDLRELTDLVFANNFIIAEEARLGVWFRKYVHGSEAVCSYFSHVEWQRLYQHYCDTEFAVPIVAEQLTSLKKISQLVVYRSLSRIRRLFGARP